MPFNVHCMRSHAHSLEAATAHSQAQAHAWEQPWRQEIDDERHPVRKAQIRERFRVERHRLVRAGELAFSRDDLVRHELERLIVEQRWRGGDWPEIPPGGRVGSGRRWASENADWETQVYVRCTPEQEDLLNRVCYWTSLKPVRELQEWTGRWGRGPAEAADMHPAVQGMAYMLAMLFRPDRQAMDEKQKLRAQILHPADMMRVAIHRAGTGYEPPSRVEYEAWKKARDAALPAGGGHWDVSRDRADTYSA